MRVIAGMSDRIALGDTGRYAQRIEALGYDVLHVPETIHDSMAVALLALEHTTTLRVQTSLTLAFPRSPMLLALQAWDLSLMSGGRFDLGLATQIKQNIEGRFGVPWSSPAERMGDYVAAVRACWNSFSTGEPLNVHTDNYTLTRLQPFFNPGPLPHDPPHIWLGGVNDKACELGGAIADGFVTHPTNSHPRYLRERCLPALRKGQQSVGRAIDSVPLVGAIPIVTGRTPDDLEDSRGHQRAVLAFLYSTPAYRRTLELFGWQELGEKLQHMTRKNDWAQLSDLITDDIFETLVPQATWADLASVLSSWFSGLLDGVLVQPPSDPAHDGEFASVVKAIAVI
ncbi:MAG: TIGR03617 family F420-dependent LLM class oxidoreductase [Ilumatobacteraceae bacterium]|nr:TIGR03617 family F420-dependent LLM class oxidoreductase [Ilumatobacteraceae bacterium]